MSDSMKIFKVRAPFVDKTIRFGPPGKLVVGIAESALKANETYGFQLGNSKIIYTGNSGELLAYAHACGSVWTNPKGIRVAILPVEIFQQHGTLEVHPLPKRQIKEETLQLAFGGTF